MAEITACIERQTLNLLLIGMPGCGKTTIGQALAAVWGGPWKILTSISLPTVVVLFRRYFPGKGRRASEAGSIRPSVSWPSSQVKSLPAAAESSPNVRTGTLSAKIPQLFISAGTWNCSPRMGVRYPSSILWRSSTGSAHLYIVSWLTLRLTTKVR